MFGNTLTVSSFELLAVEPKAKNLSAVFQIIGSGQRARQNQPNISKTIRIAKPTILVFRNHGKHHLLRFARKADCGR
eukprot:2348462-Amphidinium_carterae.1